MVRSHEDDSLEVVVALRILACEGVRIEKERSSVRFAVTWEARLVGQGLAAIRRGSFAADPTAWDGKDYGQLAERLSEAIAGMSAAVAADLPTVVEPPPRTPAETTSHDYRDRDDLTLADTREDGHCGDGR